MLIISSLQIKQDNINLTLIDIIQGCLAAHLPFPNVSVSVEPPVSEFASYDQ